MTQSNISLVTQSRKVQSPELWHFSAKHPSQPETPGIKGSSRRRWKLILNCLLSHFINSLLWLPGLIVALYPPPPTSRPLLSKDLRLFALSPQSRGCPLICPSKASLINLLPVDPPKWLPFPWKLSRGMLTRFVASAGPHDNNRLEARLLNLSLFSSDSSEAHSVIISDNTNPSGSSHMSRIQKRIIKPQTVVFTHQLCRVSLLVFSGDDSLHRGLPVQRSHISPNGTH